MKWSLVKFVAVFLTLTTTAFCQLSNMDFNGSGARAEGMGKAYLAVSDDISAVSWNPAGLFVFEKPVIGFSYSTLLPRGSYEYAGNKEDQSGSFSEISMLSFLAPLRLKGHHFVLAGCYGKAFDEFQNSIYDTSFVYSDSLNEAADAYLTQNTEYEGGPFVINFGFGTRVYDKISFGFSTNLYTGKAENVTLTKTTIDSLERTDSYNQEIYYEEDVSIYDTVKFSGVNFTLGFKYNSEKLNAGLIIKTPYDLKVTTDRSIYTVTKYNGLVKTNWTDTIFVDDILQKVEIPMIIGLGGAYNVTDNFLVSMDLEYRHFEDHMVNTRTSFSIQPGGDKEETYVEEDPMWQDVMTLRLGAEYNWETGSRLFPEVPLRVGFGYLPLSSSELRIDTITLYDSLFQVVTTRKTSGVNFSAGMGVHWTQIYLDFAWSYSTYDKNNDIVGNEQALKNRNHHFNLTFTGYF
ncbi:MAG: OmpP1/FadL family transporter [Candidatus Zixiibacteriota bacterium]